MNMSVTNVHLSDSLQSIMKRYNSDPETAVYDTLSRPCKNTVSSSHVHFHGVVRTPQLCLRSYCKYTTWSHASQVRVQLYT